MSQLGLFAPGAHTLVDDATGRIAYAPGFVARERAQAWFEALSAGVDWRAERRVMYDRELDVPRLVASFRLAEIAAALAHRDTASTPRGVALAALAEAARLVSDETGVAFTSVGLNRYRDGQDSVAPHNDKLHDLAVGAPIALVSLGATRRMTIRAKAAPRRAFHLDLEPGSLLTMSYATQLHYDHGIPKTRDAVGARISLAFRVRV